MKNRLFTFIQQTVQLVKTAATRPMTQHEYDFAMAISGAKRCPHCQKWLHHSGAWKTGPR